MDEEVDRKSLFLPIEQTPYGFVQRAVFHHPDLCHEHVLELSSPFALVEASGTRVFTFLLLGDQNAGKSTFLHSFSYSADANWLQLSSFLPMLSASFINTRFLAHSLSPRDEPPFIDTDLARASFLMTLADFAFFVDEFALPATLVTDAPADARFALLQFVEVGGDHLDRLVANDDAALAACDPLLPGIVAASRALLSAATRSVYWLNARTLFAGAADAHAVAPPAWDVLCRRLRYLDGLFPPEHDVVLLLTRLPPGGDGDAIAASLSARLAAQAAAEGWALRLAPVACVQHLTSAGALDAGALVASVARMIRGGLLSTNESVDAIVAAQLLRCCIHDPVRLEPGEAGGEVLNAWHTRDDFAQFLADQPTGLELPEPLMLQRFGVTAQLLAQRAVLMIHSGDTSVGLSCELAAGGVSLADGAGARWLWRPHGAPTTNAALGAAVQVRLPVDRELRTLVVSDSVGDLHEIQRQAGAALAQPGEFGWLDDERRAQLNSCVLPALAQHVEAQLAEPTGQAGQLALWLVDDWRLAALLAGRPAVLRLAGVATASVLSYLARWGKLESASPSERGCVELELAPA